MYKITTDTLLETKKILNRSLDAINRLERLCGYKNVHVELRSDISKLLNDLESRFMLSEWENSESRFNKDQLLAEELWREQHATTERDKKD